MKKIAINCGLKHPAGRNTCVNTVPQKVLVCWLGCWLLCDWKCDCACPMQGLECATWRVRCSVHTHQLVHLPGLLWRALPVARQARPPVFASSCPHVSDSAATVSGEVCDSQHVWQMMAMDCSPVLQTHQCFFMERSPLAAVPWL